MEFIVGFRLDGRPDSNGRRAQLRMPLSSSKALDKEQILLQFCGQIAQMRKGCLFYKDVQVMAPFLERPIRLKYLVRFPDDDCAVLEAVTNRLDMKKKAKELKDHFDIAKQNNKTKMKIRYPVLLTAGFDGNSDIEKEYDIIILQSTNAINFFKQTMKNGQSH